MPNFRRAAYKFCKFIKNNPDKDPSHAVFAVTVRERIEKGELLRRWRSETAGAHVPDINEEDVSMDFKLQLLHRSGSEIGRGHARRFYHYLEVANLIETDRVLDDYVHWGAAEDGFSTGSVEPDVHEGRVTIRLTNEGINFADRSPVNIVLPDAALYIAILAVVVSAIGLII